MWTLHSTACSHCSAFFSLIGRSCMRCAFLTCPINSNVNPGLSSLALGTDLTTLGLNLSTPGQLYAAFSSPFGSDVCIAYCAIVSAIHVI